MKPQYCTCLQIYRLYWFPFLDWQISKPISNDKFSLPCPNVPWKFHTAVYIWTFFHFNYILFARTLLTFVCLAFSHWKLSFLLRQLLSCVDIRPLELIIYQKSIHFTKHGKKYISSRKNTLNTILKFMKNPNFQNFHKKSKIWGHCEREFPIGKPSSDYKSKLATR